MAAQPDLRALLSAHALDVAPQLLGATLTSTLGGVRVTVRITEVEAYGGEGEDPGSHAFRGRTPRTDVMFGDAGFAYVYFTYGMHWCANVVTGPEASASAVLLRAGEIIDGIEAAQSRRPAARKARELARGPARFAAALGIDGAANGVDLLASRSPLRLRLATLPSTWSTGPRTGVAGAGASTPWRFWLTDEPTVSPYRPAASRAKG